MTPDPFTRVSMLEALILERCHQRAVRSLANPAAEAPAHSGDAAAVGTAMALAMHDRLVVHHRQSAALLARGASVADLVAERLVPARGWIGNRPGALYRWAAGRGVLLTSTLAGSELSLVPGVALSQKAARPLAGGVAVALFDSAAAPAGLAAGTLRSAREARLPMLLVATVPAAEADGSTVDGDDVEAVYAAVRDALAMLRSGGSARQLTLRLAPGADAVARQTQRLLDADITSAGELAAMHQRGLGQVTAALVAATTVPEATLPLTTPAAAPAPARPCLAA